MNKHLFTILIFLLAIEVSGQVKRPKKSPLQKIEQKIGVTNVQLEYYRPSMKGRVIFGDLVEYNKIWRTGANRNTVITFDKAVEINGTALKAGSYAIYSKPNVKNWEIYFYKDTENWGVPKEWDKTKIAVQITVPNIKLNVTIETLNINFENIKESSASIAIMWENSYVSVPIDFHFKRELEKITRTELNRNATDFHIAAVNYYERNYDLEQAKLWMEKAIFIREKPNYWDYKEYSVILSKLKKYDDAIKAAEKSSELAKLKPNDDRALTTIKINTSAIKKWKRKK